nr:hypothetical protein BaRGS_033521 [Batillaria attramentaria]
MRVIHVGLNTLPNLLPLMSGKAFTDFSSHSLSSDHLDTLGIPFLWDELKNAGYRTLFAEDFPYLNIFHSLWGGFKRPPADHYYRVFELAKETNSELFSEKERCFGTQPNDELILNYTLAFQRLFRDKPHFGLTFLTRSTHDDVNNASQVAGYYSRYLTSLVDEGLVNNTLLIVFSDHGIRSDDDDDNNDDDGDGDDDNDDDGDDHDDDDDDDCRSPPTEHAQTPESLKNTASA